MYPILGRYGTFFLYSYTVCWGIALLLSWLWIQRHGKGQSWAALVAALAGLVAGRVGFIVTNWSYYAERPIEIWQMSRGGISAQPALLTILLILIIYANRSRDSNQFWGVLTLPLVISFFLGWAACYLEGCGYGLPTTLHPLAADLPDSFGVFALRYQTQLLGISGALVTVALAFYLQRRQGFKATHFWFSLLLLIGQQLLLLFWRGDPALIWFGWRADGWLMLITTAVALLAIRHPWLD